MAHEEASETGRSFYFNYINSIPVDLITLCSDFGWILKGDDLKGEDGYIIMINESKKIFIYYDNTTKSISSNRYRFTIAHEIGHLILGHHKLNQNKINEQAIYNMEKEADIVAAEILMPYSVLRKQDSFDINELSELFKVSKEAMTVRIDSLGLNKDKCEYELSSKLAY